MFSRLLLLTALTFELYHCCNIRPRVGLSNLYKNFNKCRHFVRIVCVSSRTLLLIDTKFCSVSDALTQEKQGK